MSPIRRLTLVVNASKANAPHLAEELAALARDMGVSVKVVRDYPLPRDALEDCDACCVIGGDGTLLGVVPEAARGQVPVIGVNRGRLGFLTTYSSAEARMSFAALLAGDYQLAPRALLSCRSGPGAEDLALNDVLIKDERNSRLVRLEVFADGELVTDYYCDGLIFATPTGSTAYNLSAGGPIIHPSAEVIAMTPICPHTLSNRSIIFRDGVRLSIRSTMPESRILIAVDGHRTLSFAEGDTVEIEVAPSRLQLVQRRDYSHFEVVRSKLKWSGGVASRDEE